MCSKTIIVADDDAAICTVLSKALSRAGYKTKTVATIAALQNSINKTKDDLIITDVIMPDGNIFDVLAYIKDKRPNVPILVMSAQNTFLTAIKAIEKGAYDYLPKPFDLKNLVKVVEEALKVQPFKNMNMPSETEIPFIGRSSAMQDVYRTLAKLMQNDLTVLIEGESGTGKELAARALHDYGKRKKGPFVAINMAAIPHDLIESELFGYEKGAFTGANTRNTGHFEQAENGTLFLDEIGDMPMNAQTRLLRVLQQGEFIPIGGHRFVKTNVRIIAATNKNLLELVQCGLFREDLFYRLNVVPLRLPPLRERITDIDDLTRHFLTNAKQNKLGAKQIEQSALEQMKGYHWPGNVRELENMIHRLVVLYPQDIITQDLINQELEKNSHPFSVSVQSDERQDFSSIMETTIKNFFNSLQKEELSNLYQKLLISFEKPLIEAVLSYTDGNKIKAAQILGLNRNTLHKKIKFYAIESKNSKFSVL